MVPTSYAAVDDSSVSRACGRMLSLKRSIRRFAEVAADPQAAIDRTAEEAASSRLIDGFFTWVKKQGGGA